MGETVETVPEVAAVPDTPLKWGVNENAFRNFELPSLLEASSTLHRNGVTQRVEIEFHIPLVVRFHHLLPGHFLTRKSGHLPRIVVSVVSAP